MRFQLRLVLVCALALSVVDVSGDEKLTGTVIGTRECVDYSNTSKATTTVNTCANAFDGDLNTFFASWDRSYTWAGLDLGSPHVITKVGWSPRNDSQGEGRVALAVFEGANSPDFMDALPLYLIEEKGKIGQLSYADVNCSRGFRYVRYVGPADARCNQVRQETACARCTSQSQEVDAHQQLWRQDTDAQSAGLRAEQAPGLHLPS